jgi:hypothetical protein
MKPKVLLLLAILVALFAWTFMRERFEATASIKKPPYDEAEAKRIFDMMSKTDQDAVIETRRGNSPGVTDPKILRREAEKHVANTVKDFYERVFAPATVPITAAQIDQIYSREGPGGPAETKAFKNILKTYFVGQSGVGTSVNTGYAAALAELGQNPGYLNTGTTAGGSTGESVVGSTPATGVGSAAATMSGTTTGGSSTSSLGPTSGTTGASGQRVFGPVFTARGAGGGMDGGDSSKTNTYPELMGGRGGAASTKVDGAGIVSPSKNWLLTTDGSLPSMDSLGASEMSKYFPTSRTPGDMDLIPDPYRLSRNFSTSSYSSKTEPAPFLTDFSAFLK